MTWEVRQDPKDPNAWDVYEGQRKIAHLPWCSKKEAALIAAAPLMRETLTKVERGDFHSCHYQGMDEAGKQEVQRVLDEAEGTAPVHEPLKTR